jgi:hypothetical protein
MSQLFSLDAQVAGIERHVRAAADGTGITLYRDGDPSHVRSTSAAIREARDYIGEFIIGAQKTKDIPWGLRVTVSDGAAVYGEWPLTGGGSADPSFQNTPLVRIRNRWHDSGPVSALQNAVEILRAYTAGASAGGIAA